MNRLNDFLQLFLSVRHSNFQLYEVRHQAVRLSLRNDWNNCMGGGTERLSSQ